MYVVTKGDTGREYDECLLEGVFTDIEDANEHIEKLVAKGDYKIALPIHENGELFVWLNCTGYLDYLDKYYSEGLEHLGASYAGGVEYLKLVVNKDKDVPLIPNMLMESDFKNAIKLEGDSE